MSSELIHLSDLRQRAERLQARAAALGSYL